MSVEVLGEAAAKCLDLYVKHTNDFLNKGVAPEKYVSYHATEADRRAAVIAGEYAEADLRGAVVMAGLLARSKLPKKPTPPKGKIPLKRA